MRRVATTSPFALLAVGVALQFAAPARAGGTAAPANKTIVFVCLHGSVKSQMAAAHFNRIARERGLPFVAVSRGIAVDSSIPARIRGRNCCRSDTRARDGSAAAYRRAAR